MRLPERLSELSITPDPPSVAPGKTSAKGAALVPLTTNVPLLTGMFPLYPVPSPVSVTVPEPDCTSSAGDTPSIVLLIVRLSEWLKTSTPLSVTGPLPMEAAGAPVANLQRAAVDGDDRAAGISVVPGQRQRAGAVLHHRPAVAAISVKVPPAGDVAGERHVVTAVEGERAR